MKNVQFNDRQKVLFNMVFNRPFFTLANMTIKMKKKAGIGWFFAGAGFQFGSAFDDVHIK